MLRAVCRATSLITASAIAMASYASGEPIAGEFSDPMRPDRTRSAAAPARAEFEVTAIFHSAERQTAIVNGHLVAAGDRVDGAEVVAIGPRALKLRYRGKSIQRALPVAESGTYEIKKAH